MGCPSGDGPGCTGGGRSAGRGVAAALTDYSAALELDPDLWQARLNRAILRYDAGDLADSAADLDRAIALAPEEPQLYQSRSIVRASLGRHAEAISDLDQFLRRERDPHERQEAMRRRAELQALAGMAEAACDLP